MPVRRLLSRIALPLVAVALAAVAVACQPLVGTPSAYTYLYPDPSHPGRYVAWQPCTTLHFRVNLAAAPPNAAQDVLVALGQITASTGMHFTFDGFTSYLPWKDLAFTGYPAGTDVVIAWSPASQVPGLAGDVVGIGGGTLRWGAGLRTRPVKGSVVVDADTPLRPGFGYGVTDGSLIMHEMGHVLGLGDSPEAVEVMFPGAACRQPVQLHDRRSQRAVEARLHAELPARAATDRAGPSDGGADPGCGRNSRTQRHHDYRGMIRRQASRRGERRKPDFPHRSSRSC